MTQFKTTCTFCGGVDSATVWLSYATERLFNAGLIVKTDYFQTVQTCPASLYEVRARVTAVWADPDIRGVLLAGVRWHMPEVTELIVDRDLQN